jgi:hypothetical protein
VGAARTDLRRHARERRRQAGSGGAVGLVQTGVTEAAAWGNARRRESRMGPALAAQDVCRQSCARKPQSPNSRQTFRT